MNRKDANKNYYYNFSLPSLEKSEFVHSQNKVKFYQYGSQWSDYCGCSWIALYNAFIFFGHPIPPPVIIRWMERQPVFRGLFLKGFFGSFPWSVAKYIREQGYNVTLAYGKKNIEKKSAGHDAGILFYLRKNFSGHYTFFTQKEKEPVHFFNNRMGDRNDRHHWKGFWKKNNVLLPIGIFISEI